jgi:hypothetical protein
VVDDGEEDGDIVTCTEGTVDTIKALDNVVDADVPEKCHPNIDKKAVNTEAPKNLNMFDILNL